VKRAVQQFTPYSWTKFDWAATKNFKHFLVTLLLITIVSSVSIIIKILIKIIQQSLQAELNAFYLKYLLWLPPKNIMNPMRLVLMFLNSTAAIRELYQYLTDKQCKRLGAHAWVDIAIIMTETLICVKFGRNEFEEPAPTHIIVFWLVLAVVLIVYALWRFLFNRSTADKRKSDSIFAADESE
jgi:phosphatidylserine synthase 2